jgi:gentisate 1,2-dioxygenase
MEAVAKTPEREAFYKKIDGESLSALWNVLGDLVTPEPRSACRPHLWKFDTPSATT